MLATLNVSTESTATAPCYVAVLACDEPHPRHQRQPPALRAMPDNCVDLIYLDPPFNSGAVAQIGRGQRAVHARSIA